MFPDSGFDAEAVKIAKKFAALPTRAVAVRKRLISESFETSLETQIEREADGVRELGGSRDFQERVRAFNEKREARFTGE